LWHNKQVITKWKNQRIQNSDGLKDEDAKLQKEMQLERKRQYYYQSRATLWKKQSAKKIQSDPNLVAKRLGPRNFQG